MLIPFVAPTRSRANARSAPARAHDLEGLAFEPVDPGAPGAMFERAEALISGGVRRVFAVFVEDREVGEWAPHDHCFIPLDPNGTIDDPTLARPVPVRALLHAQIDVGLVLAHVEPTTNRRTPSCRLGGPDESPSQVDP